MSVLHEIADSVELVVYLGFALFLGAVGATLFVAQPTGRLYVDIALWLCTFVAAIAGVVALARALRRRRFGDAPAEPAPISERLMEILSGVAGILLLVGCTRGALRAGPNQKMLVGFALLGVAFVFWAGQAFWAYVRRR